MNDNKVANGRAVVINFYGNVTTTKYERIYEIITIISKFTITKMDNFRTELQHQINGQLGKIEEKEQKHI